LEANMSTIAFGHTRDISMSADVRPVRHLHAVRDPRSTPHVRLTRRGKAVILAAAVATIALLVVMFGSSSIAGDHAGVAPETTTVRVLPGHTLWEIAAEANPNGDIRQTVDEIVRLNSLPNASALQMGSEIAVPVYH
jgi:Tfp pilus assembly protein FimV